MGKLLSILRYPSKHDVDIFVDFENAQPTELEVTTYRSVDTILTQAKDLLSELQTYKGAVAETREAINNPNSEEAQASAWTVILEHVVKLQSYYEFSKELERVVAMLLGELCSGDMTSTQHLEQQQSLVRQFAQVLDFTLAFDKAKMSTPAVQNDFSYFRRKSNHMKSNGMSKDGPSVNISSEIQGRMSLFFAEACPMMKCVSDTTCKFVSDHKEIPLEITTETLAKMAAICRVTITTTEYRDRLSNQETVLFILRVMVGVLILYDHVHPLGAFVKNSNIEMEKYAKVLKQQASSDASDTNLLDVLKFTSRHFNDGTTPDHVKRAFIS